MNKKAVQLALATMVVTVVLLLLLAFVGLPWITKIRSGTSNVLAYSACENAVGSNYGMCSNTGCPTESSEQLGTVKGGCPSSQIKVALKLSQADYSNDEIDTYSQCCIVEKCSDIVDSKTGARQKGCYIESKCKTDFKQDVFDSITKCVGHAEDCLAKDGCCCVLAK